MRLLSSFDRIRKPRDPRLSNSDDRALQRNLGRKIGAIIVDTMGLAHRDRQAEIERRVRAAVAA